MFYKEAAELVFFFLLFRPDGRSLARHSLETSLDGLDRAPRVASHALQEKESLLLVQDGVRRSASVAGDVLLDVPPQHVLDVLLLEPALHDELVVAVDGADRSQLGRQEGQQMLGLTVKPEAGRKRKLEKVRVGY